MDPERHRVIGADEIAELLPALAGREPTSGYLFHDCQTDDSRLVLTVLGEAERFGAVCANRVRATDLLVRDGRAAGVAVRDEASGATFDLHAGTVVNATGVWADRLRPEELHEEAELPRIRPSRGAARDRRPRRPAGARRGDRARGGGRGRSSRCRGWGRR